jgi:hypothetical protein
MIPNQNIAYISADGRLTAEGMRFFREMGGRLSASEARLAAIAAIVAPTGGATIDAEARAAIAAIIAGAA